MSLTTLHRWLSALLFVAVLCVLGLLTGGVVGARLSPPTGMGWDRLADTLGGMMVGVLLALPLGGVLATRLTTAGRYRWTGVLVLVAALAIGVLRFLRAG